MKELIQQWMDETISDVDKLQVDIIHHSGEVESFINWVVQKGFLGGRKEIVTIVNHFIEPVFDDDLVYCARLNTTYEYDNFKVGGRKLDNDSVVLRLDKSEIKKNIAQPMTRAQAEKQFNIRLVD